MEISITLPDEVAERMQAEWRDLPRHALEALVVDAYRTGLLTAAQLRDLLGLGSRLEVDGFLKRAGAYIDYTEEDLEDEISAGQRLARS